MTNIQIPNKILRGKYLLITLLFALTIGERLLFDLGPNFELITVSMLLISAYMGMEKSLWFVLITMLLSDAILGNTNIFLFTWSGFLIPVIFASLLFRRFQNPSNSTQIYETNKKQSVALFRKLKANSLQLTAIGTGMGIFTSLFFFVWTNFGVWALDSWNMYSNDIAGLTQSYINALPFLKYSLISTIATVPAGFIISEVFRATYFRFSKFSQPLPSLD